MLTAMFMALYRRARVLRPDVVPRERGARSVGERAAALADVVPFALLIGGIMGSIYAGCGDADRGGVPAAACSRSCCAWSGAS